MGIYVANQVIKLLIKKGHKIEGFKVLVLGITFKENCPNLRNSRVIEELKEFGYNITVSDYLVNKDEVKYGYSLELKNDVNYSDYEAIVLAVAHEKYKN